MAPVEDRLRVTDHRYGHICPRCAGPKSLQAARCRACYFDDRTTGRFRRMFATGICPDCGGPMWSTSRRCRTCWLAAPDPQPPDHPWRRLRLGRRAA